jgi:hypothetical protein
MGRISGHIGFFEEKFLFFYMGGPSHSVVFSLSCAVYFIINSGTEKIPTVPINVILNLLTSPYVLHTTQYTVLTNLTHRKEILRRLS